MSRDLSTVSMFTSWEARCGIASYSAGVVAELRRSLDVRVVPARFDCLQVTEYRALGEAMNEAQLAHVQHSYAFFGGMRPPGAGGAAFLAAIRVPLVMTVHELDIQGGGGGPLPAPL